MKYFTTRIVFPDGKVWVKQEPFRCSMSKLVKNLAIDGARACELKSKLETSWHDSRGVEIKCSVEEEACETHWPTEVKEITV